MHVTCNKHIALQPALDKENDVVAHVCNGSALIGTGSTGYICNAAM
jgi:hypothetical protein